MLYHWAIRALLVGKNVILCYQGFDLLLRQPGIEPRASAWKALMLPLHHWRQMENLRDSFTCFNTKPPPPKAGNIPLDQTDATISHHATSINTALTFTAPSWESTLMHVHSGVIEEIWVDMEVEGSATGAHQNIPGPTLFVCWWPGDKHQAGMLILALCTQVIRIVTSLALTKVAFAMLKLGGGMYPPQLLGGTTNLSLKKPSSAMCYGVVWFILSIPCAEPPFHSVYSQFGTSSSRHMCWVICVCGVPCELQ